MKQSSTFILDKLAQHLNVKAAPGPGKGRTSEEKSVVPPPPGSLAFFIQTLSQQWGPGCTCLCLTGLTLSSAIIALEQGKRLQSLCTSIRTPTVRGKGNSRNHVQENNWCLHVMCLKDLQL